MGEVVHYRDPDTKLLACDGEDRRPEDLMTSMREHVTCTRCLAAGPLPDWREAVKAPAVAPGQVRRDGTGVEWTVLSLSERKCSDADEDGGERWWTALSRADGRWGFERTRFPESRLASWPVVGLVSDESRLARWPVVGSVEPEPRGSAYDLGVLAKMLDRDLVRNWTDGKLPSDVVRAYAREDVLATNAMYGKTVARSAYPVEVLREAADRKWLAERGEDAASLRALVEAVDAACEKVWGPEVDPRSGARRWPDTRAEAVNDLAAGLAQCADNEEKIDELEARVAELEDTGDPGDEDAEDVPIGGLSHEKAHFLISGVEGAASMLDRADAAAWPDARARIARYLRGLLK